ncbi:imidazole glycerol phosphate synthase subunit HisH [Bacillus cytotoxicus]|uniref:Imidazole glycerol phosphate synthase subunit HisH n=1 Tax=Bacillus cytotoxicus (strain DSM 22905 / CIP 110041 / 391-98 / NVH 391-98) TaxID=315749 RepID=HIS5_BACCN|nr:MULTISPECIES: imidazole glycerol phosphate synthase subunit HisH [Bacillus cereus group]A7GMU8.1 RecName: Full=Imidazole glycerol phosphate synthase subunit HisH; AltName: Full=IGP synthase glutaminase subunit; AltName: Full=IGP synthase subunit HisH; AltName: Full=ImGP synthase subunit HisH; Short=IGPS subunit HisH [Bacillus cytotoxicus NVH 391-98]ABS21456.1 imidazole glycerol phosphate synthase, glutamine amidotransferase subunit [Bacillus cytotoxicus NVH 391-98]AWC32131.1 imidazole glycero
MIAIIDYGMGNIRSIEQALTSIGVEHLVTDRQREIVKSDGVILPGVGAFPKAMEALEAKKLVTVLQECGKTGKPLLGICLGMQLLFEKSEEMKSSNGLGLLPGVVRKLQVPYKIPHMGWNRLTKTKEMPIWNRVADGSFVYYVHSYYAECPNDMICGTSEYGISVPGLVAKGNIFGAQFHPEKSGEIGIQMLANFKGVVKQWKSSQLSI